MVNEAPRLVARDLHYTYDGPVVALRGVDVALADRELVAVIGPNGSGKSTLLRCLAGLLAPGSGALELDGVPLASLPYKERARRLAVVPQYLPLLPDVRVLHFVLGGRYPWLKRLEGTGPRDLEIARLALADCDALDLETRLMSDLSGGQRQRVLLARALAQEAQVLLIDEPTNSLDPEHQIRVFELIRNLADQGRAVMVITHDLNLASQFGTRALLLADGRVTKDGALDQVLVREVLEPVYGRHLLFGRTRQRDGSERPYVLPWRTIE
jgi:iron complex transport system ATP-binding protein